MRLITLPLLLISLSASASIFSVSKEEANKAPKWPAQINFSDKQCSGVLNDAEFQDLLSTLDTLNSFMYQALRQVDLNGDGDCEYIAFQTMDCGVGSCSTANITVHGEKVLFVGGQPEYWNLHQAEKGWLQLGTESHAGSATVAHRLYRFDKDRYTEVRRDKYKLDDADIYRYQKTVTDK